MTKEKREKVLLTAIMLTISMAASFALVNFWGAKSVSFLLLIAAVIGYRLADKENKRSLAKAYRSCVLLLLPICAVVLMNILVHRSSSLGPSVDLNTALSASNQIASPLDK